MRPTEEQIRQEAGKYVSETFNAIIKDSRTLENYLITFAKSLFKETEEETLKRVRI